MYKIIGLLCITLSLQGCSGLFKELVFTDEEKELLRESAQDAVACQVSQYLQTPMWRKPLFAYHEGSCEPVAVRDETLFSEELANPTLQVATDALCRQPVNYQLTRYHSFCNEYTLTKRLGADQSLEDNNAWTLNPASRFRTPLLKQYRFLQPYMTTRVYKQQPVAESKSVSPVDEPLALKKGSGFCALQMRIYKSSIHKTGLKPLIVMHGGDWDKRGFHAMGLESRIPEWTDQGFVVFMPFYRLMGEGETTHECSSATWFEVKQDAINALAWVKQHANAFGADQSKPALLAQGSGAMLAANLLVNEPDAFSKAVFFYPQLDSQAMLDAIQAQPEFAEGIKNLERLMDAPLSEINNDNLVFQETQLFSQMAAAKAQLPPIKLLHGLKDRQIPASQSIGACSALAGHKVETHRQTQAYACGNAELFLFAGAEHHLDYCFGNVKCPAGDSDSRKAVAKVLKKVNRWLKEPIE